MILQKIGRWIRRKTGSAAVEFSLLAWPFFMTSIGIIDLAMYFSQATFIQRSMMDATRMIKVGELQSEPDLATQRDLFLDAICDISAVMMTEDCKSNLQYEVRKLTGFDEDITPDFDEDGNFANQEEFDADNISAGCVALVRVMYEYEFMTPLFGNIFADREGVTSRRIMATTVLRTEPYDFEEEEDCQV